MLPKIAIPLCFALLTAALTAQAASDWTTGVPTRSMAPGTPLTDVVAIKPDAWEQIDGCAKSIAARAVNQVVVVGCDGAGGSGPIFHWRAQGHGGRWETEPAGTKMYRWDLKGSVQQLAIPATASSLAISGEAPPPGLAGVGGVVYTIDGDALLYARPIELSPTGASSWTQFAGTTQAWCVRFYAGWPQI